MLPGAMTRARRIVAAQVEQLSDLVENLVDLAALARGSVNVREGIGSDQLPHVFDLFTRSGTLGSSTRGMDIGLALVREIAELHGGSVDARSAGPGAGSTIIVRFPASRPTTPSRRP